MLGQDDLVVPDVPDTLLVEKYAGATVVPCLLCRESVPLAKMRNHVGYHIMRSMRQEIEYLEGAEVRTAATGRTT